MTLCRFASHLSVLNVTKWRRAILGCAVTLLWRAATMAGSPATMASSPTVMLLRQHAPATRTYGSEALPFTKLSSNLGDVARHVLTRLRASRSRVLLRGASINLSCRESCANIDGAGSFERGVDQFILPEILRKH